MLTGPRDAIQAVVVRCNSAMILSILLAILLFYRILVDPSFAVCSKVVKVASVGTEVEVTL